MRFRALAAFFVCPLRTTTTGADLHQHFNLRGITSLEGVVSPGIPWRFTMCALVMKSDSVVLPKARNWGLIDQLRWKVECLFQRVRGEV